MGKFFREVLSPMWERDLTLARNCNELLKVAKNVDRAMYEKRAKLLKGLNEGDKDG